MTTASRSPARRLLRLRLRARSPALLGILLLPAPAAAQSIEDVVIREMSMAAPSAVVMQVRYRGEHVFTGAFGRVAHGSADSVPADALFAVPEMVEPLAAAVGFVLASRGELDLDGPVGEYVEGLPPRVGRVTFRQLVTHTAGLDDAEPPESRDDLVESLSDAAVLTGPGVVFSISRYDFPLAVRTLEAASGLRFEALVGRAILAPLGMYRTTFQPADARSLGLIQGYGMFINDPEPVQSLPLVDDPPVAGMPNLFTTADDLAHLLAAWYGGALPGVPATLPPLPDHVLHPREERRFAYGFEIGRFQNLQELTRGGAWRGYGVAVRVLPQQGLVVVGLDNGGMIPWQSTAFAVTRIVERMRESAGAEYLPDLEGEAEGEESEATARPLASYAGRYVNGDRLFELRVASSGGREEALVLFDGERELEVRRTRGDLFTVHIPDGREAMRLRIREGSDGRLYLFQGHRAYVRTEGVRPAGAARGGDGG